MSDRATAATPALTPLGYGAANLGNMFRPLGDDEAWEILEAAWDAGIRYFDTAPHYGLGLSERRLGAFLRTKPRDEYVLSTKVGRLLRPNPDDDGGLDTANDFHVRTDLHRVWDFSEDGVRAGVAESLERMGLDRVDVVYLHDPERHDLDLALAEALPALTALRDDGTVTAVGIGSMVSSALAACVGAADLDVIMIAGRYTLLEQPAVADTLPACRATGTDVVAASVFNSGLLARPRPDREGRYEYGRLPDALWERLQAIMAVCDAHEVPLPAAAVQFPLRETTVRSVVVGGSRPSQLRQNAEWMAQDLPDDFWAELAERELIAP
ncbi:aldo/keto reductase [Microbacterium sp. zg.Y1090]|uniref:aldo/keto reductase n=1 Tax=Microbacterium TaxID=33882 RepID=UPI00214B6A90|nr:MULTISPECIES: aldo/keto reductase [unclassified Microbacterium]MCR2811577.1 aldo/keto reductase [Microbacterium sp. zg.Y1084]MCR2819001.1 aldo/keto reductase [Microbacterium sp. zg.Y1090]MDL5487651.1 aldo/keto reductase [Microbacterium sp. zg-Y1211]WIM27306.1 aldo/keto reductase [Microbacterium sp. zg-Y1090]